MTEQTKSTTYRWCVATDAALPLIFALGMLIGWMWGFIMGRP